MQLVISTYGTYLHKKDDCFEVKLKDEKHRISANKVDSILIATGVILSNDAIELAVKNNIDIVFLDGFGNPYARIWQPQFGSTTLIRRKQLELADSDKGLALVTEWVQRKMTNQIDFLNELARQRPPKAEKVAEYCSKIESSRQKLEQLSGSVEQKRSEILGLEGSAGRAYFSALSLLIPEKYAFNGRSRQPAKDEFNAMLNYAYGILYSRVEKACIIAGLDPYVGFLHTDNYAKKSLVFDLIEPYRIIGDKTVFYLFSKRQVKSDFFKKIKNGMMLDKPGKQVLIAAFNERLEMKVRHRNRNLQLKDIIQFDCHHIANGLIKKKKKENRKQ
ncbi:CRISPR-associated endonuclease Cas1 [candidate division KSB1 bacterium]|nr:CRISPR-associated endonuclease Cas1 [candidate division KSB1 bacterium]